MGNWMYENRIVIAALLFGLSAVVGTMLVILAGYAFATGHPIEGLVDVILGVWNIWSLHGMYQMIKRG